MDAIELLKDDHRRVKKLLKEGDDSKPNERADRVELYATIRKEMEIHERIEEEIFYPALKAHPKARAIVLEGFEEHHVVDEIMSELGQTDAGDEMWLAKFTVMKENIEHHIDEEEGEMFGEARKAFDDEELDSLGNRMMELKQVAEQVDRSAASRTG